MREEKLPNVRLSKIILKNNTFSLIMKNIFTKDPRIAYFSMEISADVKIPTYAGGLGVLAGDTLRSCADLRVPVVGITLLARHFTQKVDEEGNQKEIYEEWNPRKFLTLLPQTISVFVEDREVRVRIWKYTIKGVTGYGLPVYFLDTNCEGNNEQDKKITFDLYGGDQEHRLKQEIILGIGGIKTLAVLNYGNIQKYHLNEGHSALAVLELLKKLNKKSVREKIVFTTHTPVPAGHDRFPLSLAEKLLKKHLEQVKKEKVENLYYQKQLNMTYLALKYSKYINGVAVRHQQISSGMFPNYPIESITNGVHHLFWTSDFLKMAYTQYLGESCKKDPSCLRYIFSVPTEQIAKAHQQSKEKLINFVNKQNNLKLKNDVLTIGWARRFTLYKRSYLLFMDLARLKKIAEDKGPLQIIFSGEAAPDDWQGKENLKYVFQVKKELESDPNIKVVFIENYNIDIAKLMVAGVDLWLNTPQAPLEASGTSGMKAALNGVPSLGVLDGWWLEGHLENVTGWSIGKRDQSESYDREEADELYTKLEQIIIPTYYKDKEKWQKIMQSCIMLNGSMFNSHRMVKQYIVNAYFT